jgi:ribonuclease HI
MTPPTIFFDGACEPRNPGGWMIACWILLDETGIEIKHGASIYKPKLSNTNNVAEYIALGLALRDLKDSGVNPTRLMIRGDSKLVINQMNREWACNKEYLRDLRERCFLLLKDWIWRAEWIPREQNERADGLGRELYLKTTGYVMPDRSKKR